MASDKFDAIIIGGGMAGLSCAAHLAKAEKKVVVVEQHSKPGGYCTSFPRKGITFYPAVHWIMDYEWINDILKELNGEQLQFSRHDPLLRVIGPSEGVDILLSTDRKRFEDSVLQSFSKASKESVAQLVNLSSEIEREMSKMPATSPELMTPLSKVLTGIQLPFKLRKFLKYNKMPADSLLYSLFPGEDSKGLRTTLRSVIPMADAPAFLLLFQIAIALKGRGYCPNGGADKIADVFAQAVQKNGGEILLKKRVTKIKIGNKKAVGVILEDGTEFDSKYVVSTGDAWQTFNKLINPELVPSEFKKKLESPVSVSMFTVSIVTDIDPSKYGFNSADTYINASLDTEELFSPNNPEKGFLRLVFPTLIDPSCRAGGVDTKIHGIQIMTRASIEYENYWKAGPELQRGEEYRGFKKAYADKLIKRVENYIPDLGEHILYVDISTPITYYRYTLNHRGASLGWKETQQWKQESPFIQGLYQAGHWTFPGPMINSVIPSGKFAAELILRKE